MSDLRAKLAIDTRPGHYEYASSSSATTPSSTTELSLPTPWTSLSMSSPNTLSVTGLTPIRHSRELPMPAVRSTSSLDQAYSTLLLCANKLRSQFRKLLETDPNSVEALTILAEMRRFKSWLEEWERAFSGFLATAMPTMAPPQIKRCRVAKANHLSCMILASISGVQPTDFEGFLPDFGAIVGLAAAVLDSDVSPDVSPKSVDMREIPSSTAMTIMDPLRVVVSCCTDARVRSRAARLLQRTP